MPPPVPPRPSAEESALPSPGRSKPARGALDDIPWRRIGVEFLAIFTAVLLSFIAEDWREELGQRKIERRLLVGLRDDLASDRIFFGSTIPNDSLALEAGEWLQANWRRPAPPRDSVVWALNGMYRGMPYAPTRTEYEAARNSARLDLIRSADVRKLINTHYEQTHGVLKDVWEMNLRFHFDWVSAIGPHVEFAPAFRQPLVELSEVTQDVWPAVELRSSWGELQQDGHAHAALAQTNTFRRLAIAWQRANLANVGVLQAAIQDELDGH